MALAVAHILQRCSSVYVI